MYIYLNIIIKHHKKFIFIISSFFSILYSLTKSSSLDFVVGLSGLEPPTSRLSGVRSNLLSYRPAWVSSSGPSSLLVLFFVLFFFQCSVYLFCTLENEQRAFLVSTFSSKFLENASFVIVLLWLLSNLQHLLAYSGFHSVKTHFLRLLCKLHENVSSIHQVHQNSVLSTP